MLDFKQKSRVRRTMYAKPTIIALIVLFLFIANGTWGIYQKSRVAMANKETVEAELAELTLRERELAEDIVNLSTERGIDEEIRGRFMVAKEGEEVIIIADPKVEKIHTVTVSDNGDGTLGASVFQSNRE